MESTKYWLAYREAEFSMRYETWFAVYSVHQSVKCKRRPFLQPPKRKTNRVRAPAESR